MIDPEKIMKISDALYILMYLAANFAASGCATRLRGIRPSGLLELSGRLKSRGSRMATQQHTIKKALERHNGERVGGKS